MILLQFRGYLMQNLNVGGRYFMKCYFMLLFIAVFLSTSTVFAGGTPPPSSLTGNEIVTQLQSGGLSTQQATDYLQNNANLTTGQASQLTNIISGGGAIDPQALGTMVNGFLGANSPLSGSDIGNIGNMVQQFAGGAASPEAISQVFTQMATGAITSEIGEALSNIPALGNLADLGNISQLLDQAGVLTALEGAIGELGAQGVANALGNIVGLAGDPSQVTAAAQQQAAEFLTSQIQALAPGLYTAIEDLLGTGSVGAIISAFLGSGSGSPPATAPTTEICTGLICSNPCGNCAPDIQANHYRIRDYIRRSFVTQRNWIMNNFWREYVQRALALMTAELSLNSMQQMQIIGTFFDAKHQLETQRLFQELTAVAHKDYQPSENLCTVGTNTRYFANSERRADSAQIATSERMMQRQLNNENSISYAGPYSDIRSRIDKFIERYCDPQGGGIRSDGVSSLSALCQNTPSGNRQHMNADVNFTASVENKLTLRNSYIQGREAFATDDEQNVTSLSANIFAHDTMPIIGRDFISFPDGTPKDIANLYYDVRSMAAKRSVAQNSFAAITAMRSEGAPEAGPFLKAILTESGIEDAEAEALLDINPSLFAQEEVMMKLLYQNPTFYSNLYDKPANVERMGASMLALEIIQDRNIYDSLIRSEAVLATLVETMLLKDQRRITGQLNGLNVNNRVGGN